MSGARANYYLSSHNSIILEQQLKALKGGALSADCRLKGNHSLRHKYKIKINESELCVERRIWRFHRKSTANTPCDKSTRSKIINSTLCSQDLSDNILFSLINENKVSRDRLNILAEEISLDKVISLSNKALSESGTENIKDFLKKIDLSRLRFNSIQNPNDIAAVLKCCSKDDKDLTLISNTLKYIETQQLIDLCSSCPENSIWHEVMYASVEKAAELTSEQIIKLKNVSESINKQNFSSWPDIVSAEQKTKLLLHIPTQDAVSVLSQASESDFNEVIRELSLIQNTCENSCADFEATQKALTLLKEILDIVSSKGKPQEDSNHHALVKRVTSYFESMDSIDEILTQKDWTIQSHLMAIIISCPQLKVSSSLQEKLENKIRNFSDAQLLSFAKLLPIAVVIEPEKDVPNRTEANFPSPTKWRSCLQANLINLQVDRPSNSLETNYGVFILLGHKLNTWANYGPEEVTAFKSISGTSLEELYQFISALPPALSSHITSFLKPQTPEGFDFDRIPPETWCGWLVKDFDNAGEYLREVSVKVLTQIKTISEYTPREKIDITAFVVKTIKDKNQMSNESSNLGVDITVFEESEASEFIVSEPDKKRDSLDASTSTSKRAEIEPADSSISASASVTTKRVANSGVEVTVGVEPAADEEIKIVLPLSSHVHSHTDSNIADASVASLESAEITPRVLLQEPSVNQNQKILEENESPPSIPPIRTQVQIPKIQVTVYEEVADDEGKANELKNDQVSAAQTQEVQVTSIHSDAKKLETGVSTGIDVVTATIDQSTASETPITSVTRTSNTTKHEKTIKSEPKLEHEESVHVDESSILQKKLSNDELKQIASNLSDDKLLELFQHSPQDLQALILFIKKSTVNNIHEYIKNLSVNNTCWILSQLHPFCATHLMLVMSSARFSAVLQELSTLYTKRESLPSKKLSTYMAIKDNIPNIFSRLAKIERSSLPGENYSAKLGFEPSSILRHLLNQIPEETRKRFILSSKHPVNIIFTSMLYTHELLTSNSEISKQIQTYTKRRSPDELEIFVDHLSYEMLIKWFLYNSSTFPKIDSNTKAHKLAFARISAVGIAACNSVSTNSYNESLNKRHKELVNFFKHYAGSWERKAEIFSLLGHELTSKLKKCIGGNRWENVFNANDCINMFCESNRENFDFGDFLSSIPPHCYSALTDIFALRTPTPAELERISPVLWCQWLKTDKSSASAYFSELSEYAKSNVVSQIKFRDWESIAEAYDLNELFSIVCLESPEQLQFWASKYGTLNDVLDYLIAHEKTHLISRLSERDLQRTLEVLLDDYLDVDNKESDKRVQANKIIFVLKENCLSKEIVNSLFAALKGEPQLLEQVLKYEESSSDEIIAKLKTAVEHNNTQLALVSLAELATANPTIEKTKSAKIIQKAVRAHQSEINYLSKASESRPSFTRIKPLDSETIRVFFDLDKIYPPVYQPVHAWQHAPIPSGSYKFPVSADHRMIEFAALETSPVISDESPVSEETNTKNKQLLTKMKDVFVSGDRPKNNPFEGSSIQPGLQGLVVSEQKLISIRAGEGLDSYLSTRCPQSQLDNPECFHQVLLDLELLNKNHIYLRDIKPGNLLYVDHVKRKDGTVFKLAEPRLMFIDLADACFAPEPDQAEQSIGSMSQLCGSPAFFTWELIERRTDGDRVAAKSADEYAILRTFLSSVSKKIRDLPLAPCKIPNHKNATGDNANKENPFGILESYAFRKGVLHQNSLPLGDREIFIKECTPHIKDGYLPEILAFLTDPITHPLEHKLSEMLITQIE